MDTETFKRWQPHDAIPDRVEIVSVRDEEEGLCVLLAAGQKRELVAKLVFEDFVGYRNINESFRLRTWQSQNMKSFGSLLIVDGSRWVRWLREESNGVLEGVQLTHYAIYTVDDCIDVVVRTAPRVVTL